MSEHISVEVGTNPTISESGIHSAKACVIRVLGVGGGGGNTLQHMINQSLGGVEFIAVNTDSQALNRSTAPLKVQIGVKLTNGLGAGCDPNKGRKAAEESKDDIKKLLQGSQLIFITAGMGGGTGTGAAPIIADIAQETGALTIAVVTKPFQFEGKRHRVNAEAGITELSKHVDSLIVIDNDKLLKNLGANISIINAFNEANDVLLNAVKGITDSITAPGFINLDFSDIVTIMRGRGHAIIGNGVGQGANFVEDAVQRAIHSPLIDQVDIKSATGLLVNARVNQNFPISKWAQINQEIQNYADEEADCKYGVVFDDQLAEDQIVVTILVTGISGFDQTQSESPAAIARTAAQLRRNAPTPDNNFFKQAQGYNPNAGVAPRAPQALNRPQAQPQPMDARMRAPQANMGVNPAMQQKAVGQNMPYSQQEVQINGEANNDEWSEMNEIPAIFRNKV
ncbi:MAG: cell division protein FtsZ [Candidatus Anaerobiospirillum pullicola]|uniref:Cell division protein FtsZ n=1 Tax=Candidatus Anaerobiospirillum pullicola TaxID=2838451 RepID=A0A948WZH3_9GAMM|nr:cell division protein FtsZ [Candidatus Anaerobiospirillum pullicola]